MSIVYDIDDETRQYLEAALNCLVHVADCQIQDADAEALYHIGDTLADRFGIEKIDVETVQGTDENGEEVTVIRERKRPSKGLSWSISHEDPDDMNED